MLGGDLLYERMGGAYSYRSLFNYKKKFGVRWETRYLVYTSDAALPATLYAVVRAHLPCMHSVLQRLPWAAGVLERLSGVRSVLRLGNGRASEERAA